MWMKYYTFFILACCSVWCLILFYCTYLHNGNVYLLLYGNPSSISKLPLSIKCNPGRLGNQMCAYATLYGISALLHRRPVPLTCNTKHLKDIFVGPSQSQSAEKSSYNKINSWKLASYLRPEDYHIPQNFNFLDRYAHACSYTFFDHAEDGLRKEFRFKDNYIQYAQTILHKANSKRLREVTYVGVHVRRGDYKARWLDAFGGVEVNMEFFQQAFKYFREKFENVLFMAISDDRAWCKQNLAKRFGVHVPENAPSPAHDMAILASCNHSVITYGTFGFWGAYLAGGEVVYFDKYLKHNTPFTSRDFIFDKMYPPRWKGIATVNESNFLSITKQNSARRG